MAYITGGIVGSIGADNLIAGIYPPAVAQLFDLTTSGIIERGTVLSRENDGTYSVLGTGAGNASVVVAQTTLEDDTVVEAYVSGYFYRDQLIFGDGYELTEADENNLRLAGILLTDSAEEVIQKTEPVEDVESDTADDTTTTG